MTVHIEAVYENGVFVPRERPNLEEHDRVRLTVETIRSGLQPGDIVRSRRKHRIQLDPETAQAIAESPEFDLFES